MLNSGPRDQQHSWSSFFPSNQD
uniref:Uncharacterized protein n=1 Tax=Anguilla anguilla TaxID=7936 RepID=A0A0E9S5E1_ANGAN